MRDIVFKWEGQTRRVSGKVAFECIDRVEDIVTLPYVQSLFERQRWAKVAKVMSIILRYSAKSVSEAAIYDKLLAEAAVDDVSAATTIMEAMTAAYACLTAGMPESIVDDEGNLKSAS